LKGSPKRKTEGCERRWTELRQQLQKESREIQEGKTRAREEFEELKEKV
jgi:hypothetical protein